MDEVTDITLLEYDEAVRKTMDMLEMDEPEAVLYVWIVKGLVEGDTY